jgi:hypothetical protein
MVGESQGLIENLKTLPGEDNLVVVRQLDELVSTAAAIDNDMVLLTETGKQYSAKVAQVEAEHAELASAIETRVEHSVAGYNPLADMARRAIMASLGANRIAPELAVAGSLLTDQFSHKRLTTQEINEQVERFRQLQPEVPFIVCDSSGQINTEHAGLSGKLEHAPQVDFDQIEGQLKIYLTTQDGQKGSIDTHHLPTMAIGRDEVRAVVFEWWAKVQGELPEVASYEFRHLISQLTRLSPLQSELSALEPFRDRVKSGALIKLKRALDHPASSFEMPDAVEAWGRMQAFDSATFEQGLSMMVNHLDFRAWYEAEMMVAATLKPNFRDLGEAQQRAVRRRAFSKLNSLRQGHVKAQV